MAKILRFQCHLARNPNTEGSAFSPRRVKRSVTERKCSAGMEPRIFQLQMAVVPNPTSEATAVGPPNSSITASTVFSMPPYNPPLVDVSSVHKNGMENSALVVANEAMDDWTVIGERLRAIRKHFGQGQESQTAFAKRFHAEKTAWSNWETGIRLVPIEVADRLSNEYGVSLDWLYRGNAVAMAPALLRHLQPPIRKRA